MNFYNKEIIKLAIFSESVTNIWQKLKTGVGTCFNTFFTIDEYSTVNDVIHRTLMVITQNIRRQLSERILPTNKSSAVHCAKVDLSFLLSLQRFVSNQWVLS